MKRFLLFLVASILFFSHLQVEGANISPINQEEPQKTSPSFTPQNDEGPIFPLEDLMPKPSEQTDKFYSEMLNMLATLGLIIAFILLAAWFLKRLMNTRLEQINSTSVIKIIERRALSAKTAVYLLEVNNKEILIAESQTGVTKLGEFPAETEDSPAPKETSLPTSFSHILEKK